MSCIDYFPNGTNIDVQQANDEDSQRDALSKNADPSREELLSEARKGLGRAAVLGACIDNDISAANKEGALFPESWVTGQ